MSRTTHRTFDGRVLHYDADASDPPAVPDAARLAVIRPFIEACSAVLPERALSGNAHLGLFVFLLGAADRFWQRHALDDSRFPAFAESLLCLQGVAPVAAASLSSALPGLYGVPVAREMLAEGGATMDAWLDSHDANCVLHLPELLRPWRELTLPPP